MLTNLIQRLKRIFVRVLNRLSRSVHEPLVSVPSAEQVPKLVYGYSSGKLQTPNYLDKGEARLFAKDTYVACHPDNTLLLKVEVVH